MVMGLRTTWIAMGLVSLLGCATGADMEAPASGGSLGIAFAAERAGSGGGNDAWSRLEEATVTVASAGARRAEDGAWIAVGGGFPIALDLIEMLDLGRTVTLPADIVPEGHYDAVRITMTSATITEGNDDPVTLSRPGGWTVHVPLDADVVAGEAVVIELAVRGDASFRMSGGEIAFDPAIELVAVGD
jgi:hypothetical protein